jgi:hypothetical protein
MLNRCFLDGTGEGCDDDGLGRWGRLYVKVVDDDGSLL